jgi:hypothetical protein
MTFIEKEDKICKTEILDVWRAHVYIHTDLLSEFFEL